MIQKTWRERAAAAEVRRGHRFTQRDQDAWDEMETCCVGEYAKPLAEMLGIGFHKAWSLINSKKDFSSRAHVAIWTDDPTTLTHILDQIEDRAVEVKRTYEAR